MTEFHTGLTLYTLARDKAKQLGVFEKNINMNSLIATIQQKEGYSPCFRAKESCVEMDCCWQKSCGAVMMEQ